MACTDVGTAGSGDDSAGASGNSTGKFEAPAMTQSAVNTSAGFSGSMSTGTPRGRVAEAEEGLEGGGGSVSCTRKGACEGGTTIPGAESSWRAWIGRPRIWPPPQTAQILFGCSVRSALGTQRDY